ncbi:aminotransferase class III-fold pyridoxal phosphate-dependent enzyme [Amylibacter sp.]|nr:aminotransferase class III-fold pyridoxal phosphate-dependent enzyme [Amylibacter sp.]MDB9785467.1 aminotransferase class III-fold pyridoxal phosphate-dependent enzyme [Amylibacter sp.]
MKIDKKSNEYYRSLSKKLIPGGNSLLSKRSEMFSPGMWPGYFEKALGISVTDLNGATYKDFTHFSAGTCVLGYAHPEVNEAAIRVIRSGTMSTLNSYEEVELAAKLIEMHSGMQMVKFAKTGGEANAISVRLARNYTGKNKIAFCGYHGWHDWYLSANLNNRDNLDGQLMSGLSPRGVPIGLTGSSVPFMYGDIDQLQKILNEGDIAAVKVETMRSQYPDPTYLLTLRKLCDQYGALLIFDECTSGFRESFGAFYLNYDAKPDLVVLGKTIANGFPLTTVLGTAPVMNAAQNTFISSTFFTDRIGFATALKALEVMQREHTWQTLKMIGGYFKSGLINIFADSNIEIELTGMDALPVWSYKGEQGNAIKTLITEKMLGYGYLFGSAFYPTSAHKTFDIDECLAALKTVVGEIEPYFEDADKLSSMLHNGEAHMGFKRLN